MKLRTLLLTCLVSLCVISSSYAQTTKNVLWVYDQQGVDTAVDRMCKGFIEDMSNSASNYTYTVTLEDDSVFAARSGFSGIDIIVFASQNDVTTLNTGPSIATFSGGVLSMYFVWNDSLHIEMGLGTPTTEMGEQIRYLGPDSVFINRRELDSVRELYASGADGSRGKINSTSLAANAKKIYTNADGSFIYCASLDSGVSNASSSTNHGKRVFLGTQSVITGWRDWGTYSSIRRELQRCVAWLANDTTSNSYVENNIWIGFQEETANAWNELGSSSCATGGPAGESSDSSVFASVVDALRTGYDTQPVNAYMYPIGIDKLVPEGKTVDSAKLYFQASFAATNAQDGIFNVSLGLFPIISYDSTLVLPFWYDEFTGTVDSITDDGAGASKFWTAEPHRQATGDRVGLAVGGTDIYYDTATTQTLTVTSATSFTMPLPFNGNAVGGIYSPGGCQLDWMRGSTRLSSGTSNRYWRKQGQPWGAKDFLRGTDIPMTPWDSIRVSNDGTNADVKWTTGDTLVLNMDATGVQTWVDNRAGGMVLMGLAAHSFDVEIGPSGDRIRGPGTGRPATLLEKSGIQIFLSSSNSSPPVSAFSGTPLSGNTPLSVTFTDQSTNTPTSWSWDFGDLSTSTLQNPVHSYISAGTYTVTLIVTNAFGADTLIKTNYITVSNPPNFSVDTTITEGDSLVISIPLGSDSTFVERGDTLYSYVVVDSGLTAALFWKTEIGYFGGADGIEDTANIKVYEKLESDSSVIDSFLYNVKFNQWQIVDTFLVDTLIPADFPYNVDNTKSNDSTWTILKILQNITVTNQSPAIRIRTTAGERIKLDICPTCTLFVNSSLDANVYAISTDGNDPVNGHDIDSIIIEGGTIGVRANSSVKSMNSDNSSCVFGTNVSNFMMIDVNTFMQDTGGVGGINVRFEGVNNGGFFIDTISDTSATGAKRGVWNILILRGTHSNNATRYVNRQLNAGSIFELGGNRPYDSLIKEWPNLNASYDYKVEGVTITTAPNRGINAQSRVHIINNNINISARNDIAQGVSTLRGLTKTRSGILDTTTTGEVYDSLPCFGCASTEVEAGRRVWNGSSWNTLTGVRTSTLSSASGVNGGSGQDSVWVDDWLTKDAIGNPYAIMVSNGTGRKDTTGGSTFLSLGASAGSRIEFNTLTTDDINSGGYGLLLQHPSGIPTNPVVVYRNHGVGHQARTSQSNQSYECRQRWGGEYINYYRNYFEIIVDDRALVDSTTDAAGPYEYEGKAMQIGANNDVGENSGQAHDYSILYNILKATLHTGSGKQAKGIGLNIDNFVSGSIGDTIFGSETVTGNTIQGVYTSLGLGTFEAGAKNITIYGNDIVTPPLGDTADVFAPVMIGIGDMDSYGHILLNNTFTGDGNWQDVHWNGNNLTDTNYLWYKEDGAFTTKDGSNNPVASGTITIKNGYGQTASSKVTDINGTITDTFTILYKSKISAVVSDSVGFSNFTLLTSFAGFDPVYDTFAIAPSFLNRSYTLTSSTPNNSRTLKFGSAQQGIDGTCDFGYGSSTTDAVDTMAKYFNRIGPYGECGSASNALYTSDSLLSILVYISILDMQPSFATDWATVGTYAGTRKVGWMENYLDTAHAWTTNDLKEKMYMHFYDDTRFTNGGNRSTTIASAINDVTVTLDTVTNYAIGDSAAIEPSTANTEYVAITNIDSVNHIITFTPAFTKTHALGSVFQEYKWIAGIGHDSSLIVAADSVSRVPNGYTNSTSYWSGNTYSGVTRLLPNLMDPAVRDAEQQYAGIACSTLTGGSLNFWPGKTNSFQGVFFDNSADIGLGLNTITGGHIVESYDIGIGPIASNIDSMIVSSVTSGSFIPSNRTAFDTWWWNNNTKPFLQGFDSLIDTLVTPYGKKAVYMLNCGFADFSDHYYDSTIGPHINLLEWGGTNNRGHSNADYANAGGFDRSIDSQYVKDSIAVVRGDTRQVWVRQIIGTFPGAFTTSVGGGTQNWHEGWMNTYIMFMLLNGDSTYYDMWDDHAAYLGSANPTAATSQFDSLHFGSQGTFNFRATVNRNIGARLTPQPIVFDTGTVDGDHYEIWTKEYAGSPAFPNNWRILFRERSGDITEFMSNSTPVAVTLDTTYKIYGNDYAAGNTTADTMDFWADSLTTATYNTVYLRAGEGVILYSSAASNNNLHRIHQIRRRRSRKIRNSLISDLNLNNLPNFKKAYTNNMIIDNINDLNTLSEALK